MHIYVMLFDSPREATIVKGLYSSLDLAELEARAWIVQENVQNMSRSEEDGIVRFSNALYCLEIEGFEVIEK